MKASLRKDNYCFCCGAANPHGLKLSVVPDGHSGVLTEFTAEKKYCGWSNYLHGGLISLIFDELLGWLSFSLGYDAVTARLEVRYRHPVALGSRLVLSGELERETRRILDIRTTARLHDGTLAADGKGRMMIMQKRQPASE